MRGDATPAARLIAETCDTLILHPNVVNASDINEMPANSLYVEGSVIARLLMGTIGLVPTRANRVLVIIDAHKDDLFVNAAINAVSAARSSYGLVCPEVIKLSPPVRMKAEFTDFGTAAGEISGLERVFALLEEQEGEYDAVAISSVILVPEEFHQGYFDAAGDMVNPWGGVEAMLTHAVSKPIQRTLGSFADVRDAGYSESRSRRGGSAHGSRGDFFDIFRECLEGASQKPTNRYRFISDVRAWRYNRF